MTNVHQHMPVVEYERQVQVNRDTTVLQSHTQHFLGGIS